MTTMWSHLPNARYISRILTHACSNPDQWAIADRKTLVAAWDTGWDATRSVPRDAAWNTIAQATREVAWNAARHVIAGHSARKPGGDAMIALIAWDEAGNYLTLSVDQVKMLAALGDHKAMLLLPAVMVFEKSKELV